MAEKHQKAIYIDLFPFLPLGSVDDKGEDRRRRREVEESGIVDRLSQASLRRSNSVCHVELEHDRYVRVFHNMVPRRKCTDVFRKLGLYCGIEHRCTPSLRI